MNLQEIKELILLLDNTEITELNLESDGVKIAIKKGSGSVATPSVTVPINVVDSSKSLENTRSEVASVASFSGAIQPIPGNHELVVSPMVGTFYRAAGPETPVFAELGQHLAVGQTVCIIEAMKLMNEIESEIEGKVVEILVDNGQPVEYGQPLFRIEK